MLSIMVSTIWTVRYGRRCTDILAKMPGVRLCERRSLAGCADRLSSGARHEGRESVAAVHLRTYGSWKALCPEFMAQGNARIAAIVTRIVPDLPSWKATSRLRSFTLQWLNKEGYLNMQTLGRIFPLLEGCSIAM